MEPVLLLRGAFGMYTTVNEDIRPMILLSPQLWSKAVHFPRLVTTTLLLACTMVLFVPNGLPSLRRRWKRMQPGPCSCDENGDPEYSDALGVCGGDCAEDTDGDGFVSTDGGETIDPCLTPGEVVDDCGNAPRRRQDGITTSDNQPCNPGDPGCTDADGYCNCDDEVMNVCGECGASDPEGMDCDGNLLCTDDIPSVEMVLAMNMI